MPGEFVLSGFAKQLIMDSGDAGTEEDQAALTALTGNLQCNIPATVGLPVSGGLLYIPQRPFTVLSSGQISEDGVNPGITLLANDPALGLEVPVQWTVIPDKLIIGGKRVKPQPLTFNAPAPGVNKTLDEVVPVPSVTAVFMTKGDPGDPVDDVQLTTDSELQFYVDGHPIGNPVPIPSSPSIGWDSVTGKPAVIGAGSTQAAARTAIGAGTASTKADVGLGSADDTADTAKPVSTAQQAALDGKQPLDGDLTAIAGLTSAANKVPYFTGSGAAALADFTSAGRALIDDADAAAQRATLALGNVDNTADTAKPVSTAQQTALDGKQNLDADLTALAALTTTSFGRSLLTPADALAARRLIGAGTPTRGGVGVWFGDSIGTAQDMITGSANLVDHTVRGESTFSYASILSGQRLRYYYNASKGGDNAGTAMARWDTDVAPLDFSVLVWALGTNDSWLETPIATYASYVKDAHARTAAKGAEFVICTIPPNDSDDVTGAPTSGRKKHIREYNFFLRDYAAKHGLLLVDMYNLLMDPTNGSYKTGYSTDGTHPIGSTYYLMAQLVVDTLALYLPPFGPPLPYSAVLDGNLVTEPHFTAGLNGNGVPTSWSMPSGVLRTGVTSSLVTTDTDIKGNWFKMVFANTFVSPQTLFQTITGITAGRTYRFIGRLKFITPVGLTITGRIAYDANFDYTGDATNTHEFRPMHGLTQEMNSGVFMFDSVAPASATTAQLNFQVVGSGGTGEVHFAQIGVYDITDIEAAL